MQTATFDSQFGNTEGGVTSISIKSGTNDLHGSAYYFGEPGSWAANDFFGNARGQTRPETKSDRFGGYISGPVVFPWLYNGKNKTFFLFGYEGIRDARPRFDAGEAPWVPTDALANGDFSAYNVTIWDPRTRINTGTAQSPIWTAQQSFAGNLIPADRINPVARAILEYWSTPKRSGLVGNIFDSTLTEVTQPYDNYTFRIDHNFSEKNRFFVRGSYYDRNSFYNDYTGNAYSGVNFLFKARQGVIDDVHTFNSTTFLNVRYGFNRFIRGQDQEADAQDFDLTQLWGNTDGAAYNNLVPLDIRRFPRFDFTGGPLGNGMSNEFRPVTTHSVAAILNKILGNHAIKFGGELRIYREDNSFKSNDQTGQFVFDNTYTRQASNGNTNSDVNGLQGYASFLLGLPTTMSIVRRGDYSEFSKTWGFFFQDDWKVNDRLTLNLGLRYEVETALTERQNKSVTDFDLSYTQPFQDQVRAVLAANPIAGVDASTFTTKGGLLFAGDGNERLYSVPKNVFLPRFGLAYKLNDKTAIRGGFGLFAGFLGERRGDVIQPGYTRTTTFAVSQLANGAPIPNSISAFPSINILEPVGNAQGLQTGLGGGISFFNQNPEVSRQARWQIGIQRELPWGFVAEAVYVGNFGYNIEIARNINALPNSYLNTDNSRTAAMNANNTYLSATVASPFRNIPAFAGTSFGSSNANVTRSQLLRPFPQFGDITTSVNTGKTRYHSGQFSLQKRMSHGYTFGVAYTWSKWLQATEFLNAGDAAPTWMISDQDAPHRISVNGIFELPFGKGKSVWSTGDLLDRFVGGWQIQGVYSFQTGFPIRLANNGFLKSGDLAIDSSDRTTAAWFNTAAFQSWLEWPTFIPVGVTPDTASAAQRTAAQTAAATAATPVNHLRTLPFFFTELRADNINNLDLSILKNTRINERMRFQFKLDFINALNEPYFPAPLVNPTQSTFGQISASNQNNYARRLQFGLKFLF